MNYAINDQVVLSRVPEGPLAAYLSPFADALSQQGYARYSMHRQVMLAACFSHWLKQAGVACRHVTSEHTGQYVRCRYRRRRPSQGDHAALDHFVAFLRRQRAIPSEKLPSPTLTPVQRCVQRYEQYLREDRVLAQATILNYVPFVSQFL